MLLWELMLVFPKRSTGLATRDASLPNRGFVSCIVDRKVSVPGTKDGAAKPALKDTVMMKPGSTARDVFLSLKIAEALEQLKGELAHAEASS